VDIEEELDIAEADIVCGELNTKEIRERIKELIAEAEKQTEQNIFDTLKANTTCKHEGDILRRCYHKLPSVECCIDNCIWFKKKEIRICAKCDIEKSCKWSNDHMLYCDDFKKKKEV